MGVACLAFVLAPKIAQQINSVQKFDVHCIKYALAYDLASFQRTQQNHAP